MHLTEITKLALGEINMLMVQEMKLKAYNELTLPGRVYSNLAGDY